MVAEAEVLVTEERSAGGHSAQGNDALTYTAQIEYVLNVYFFMVQCSSTLPRFTYSPLGPADTGTRVDCSTDSCNGGKSRAAQRK